LADMLPVLALASGGVAGGRHGYAVDGTVQDDDQPTGVFKDSSDSFAPTTDGAGGDGVSPMNADPKDPNNVWERVKNNWKAHFSGHPENIINPDTSSGVSPPAFSPSTQSQRENDLYKKVSSEKPLTPAPAAGLIALPEKNVPEPSYAADLQRPDVGLESGFAKQAASQIPLKDVNQNQGLAGGEPSAAPSVDAKEMSDRLSTGTAHEPSFIQRLIKDGTLSRQTVIPFLTGLAAMGTAPTRSLGVALSAGVGAGAQSYANQQEDIARLAQTQATTSQIKASTGTQMYNVAAAKAPPGTRPVAGPPSDPNQATFTTPDGQQWHYEPIYKFTNWGGTGGAGTPVGSTPTAAMKRNDDGSLYMGPSSATDNVLRQRYGFDPSLPPIANIYKASGMGHPEVMVDPTQLRAHQESIGKTGYEADDAGRTYVQLAKSLNGLSDGTFTGAGPGFEDRQNLANIYGYMTKLFGVKNDLNQNDIDQGQIIAKINKLQASALAHQNGERAASIAMGLQSSLPGGAQTKEAANTNLSAMMIQNQRARDFRDYTNSYISRYGTDAGLEESFNRDMGDVYAKEKEAIPKLFKKTQTGKSLAEELLTNPSSERRLKLERGIKQADGSYKNGIGEGSTRYLL